MTRRICIVSKFDVKKSLYSGPKKLDLGNLGPDFNPFSIERVEPCFFMTFNIILKHIFPEYSIEFPQVVQKT